MNKKKLVARNGDTKAVLCQAKGIAELQYSTTTAVVLYLKLLKESGS